MKAQLAGGKVRHGPDSAEEHGQTGTCQTTIDQAVTEGVGVLLGVCIQVLVAIGINHIATGSLGSPVEGRRLSLAPPSGSNRCLQPQRAAQMKRKRQPMHAHQQEPLRPAAASAYAARATVFLGFSGGTNTRRTDLQLFLLSLPQLQGTSCTANMRSEAMFSGVSAHLGYGG